MTPSVIAAMVSLRLRRILKDRTSVVWLIGMPMVFSFLMGQMLGDWSGGPGKLPRFLVFDLDELDYLSSAGIRVILKTRGALKKNNGKITFMNLQPQIKKVFDIINALPSMQIFANIEELDEYLDVMQKKVTRGAGL